MKGKSIVNAKNIICLVVAVALGAGFIWADKKEVGENKVAVPDKETEEVAVEIAESQAEDIDDREVVVLSASIPELSCGAIRFGEDNVIFADRDGNYAFIEDGSNSSGLTVTDDNGRVVMFANDGESLSMQSEGINIESFVFGKHLIAVKDNTLYYDSSPVKYSNTSFSAYQLTDEYVLECTERGQYRLRDSEGAILDTVDIKESEGKTIRISADETGFYAEGVNDGLFYNVFKVNGDSFFTTWGYVVYINGSELVPYGFDDEFVNPAAKGIDENAAIDPIEPPENYGDVNVHNEGLSDLTLEMLEYVNEVREQYGLLKVYGLASLDASAQVRAEELTEDFSHVRPDKDKSSYATAIGQAEVWWHSWESIAKAADDNAKEVFEAWMSSEKHRAAILDPKMKYLAAAYTEKDGDYYWELLMFNDTYVPD